MNIPVVYEDDWLLAVDKPSGLLTIPTPRNEPRTLTSILNEDARQKGQAYRLHPCHRLDRETSGVIVYAKGKSTQQKVMGEFKKGGVHKRYIAFIQGALVQRKGSIRNPLEGRPAVTEYRVLEQYKDFSVVEARPLTGRTNQLRIHFRQIGHPIVGETRFAFRKDFALRAKRLCLHAAAIELSHPATGRRLSLTAALAPELERFLREHAK